MGFWGIGSGDPLFLRKAFINSGENKEGDVSQGMGVGVKVSPSRPGLLPHSKWGSGE